MVLITSSRKSVGGCGILAVVLFCVSWMVAALADPNWVLGEKSLSRMGVSDVPLTANVFNLSCIISGGMGLVPAIAKVRNAGWAERICGSLLLVSCFSLMSIGFVQINDAVDFCLHDMLAAIFFGTAAFAMVVSAAGDFAYGHRGYALVTSASLALFVVLYFTTPFGVYEAEGVLAIMLWICLQSYRMARTASGTSPAAVPQ